MRTLGVLGSAAPVGLCICACGGAGAAPRHPAALTLTPARARSLQRRLDEKVAESGVAGASAAIVFPDGSTWKGAAGYADTATRRAMTSATALSFASITKVATAALAMRLVEQGRLALDDPILGWYPAWRGDPNATVRDLLGHTSGIADPDDAWFARLVRHPRRVVTQRQYLAATPRPWPRTSDAEYSDAGFLLAGLIEGRAAGEPVAEAMRRMVLAARNRAQTPASDDGQGNPAEARSAWCPPSGLGARITTVPYHPPVKRHAAPEDAPRRAPRLPLPSKLSTSGQIRTTTARPARRRERGFAFASASLRSIASTGIPRTPGQGMMSSSPMTLGRDASGDPRPPLTGGGRFRPPSALVS